jgi:hypothetical protein
MKKKWNSDFESSQSDISEIALRTNLRQPLYPLGPLGLDHLDWFQ